MHDVKFVLQFVSLSPEKSRIFSHKSSKARACNCHPGTMQSNTLGLIMALRDIYGGVNYCHSIAISLSPRCPWSAQTGSIRATVRGDTVREGQEEVGATLRYPVPS